MTLDELDRLHAAAEAGEWEASDRGSFWRVHSAANGFVVFDDGSACGEYSDQCTPATRDAIVALHNAWPEVSARLRAAEAALREMLKAFDGAHDLDCNASGAPDTEVCKCEDRCAEPHCECGATRARGIARAALGAP